MTSPLPANSSLPPKVPLENLRCRRCVSAQKDLASLGYRLDRCTILQASGRTLPVLEKILAAHALIHTADGELFRGAIAEAAQHLKIRAIVRERGLMERASLTLKIPAPQIPKRLATLGKALGPPWSQDEKLAALTAWLALQRDESVQQTRPSEGGPTKPCTLQAPPASVLTRRLRLG